jgi:hypothetical protein
VAALTVSERLQKAPAALRGSGYTIPRHSTSELAAGRLGRSGAAPLRGLCHVRGVRLLGADEVASAVLLPAGFVALGAEGLFFAEADGADAVGGDAQGD